MNGNENSSETHGGTSAVPFKIPKNVRQIGQVNDREKIYVEDYVMTYVKQVGAKKSVKSAMLAFLGQYTMLDNCECMFISGAVEIENVEYEEKAIFTNETWTSIYEDIKEYFSDVEILGWCYIKAGLSLTVDDGIIKFHKDNFPGKSKILFLYDSLEREDAFYLCEGEKLKRQNGYYIYYEKNIEMQNYLISKRKGKSEESTYEDKVAQDIRRVISSKKTSSKGISVPVTIMYGTGVLITAVVLVFTASTINSNDRMKGMEQTLNVISRTIVKNVSETPDATAMVTASPVITEEQGLSVTTIPGEITTIKGEEVIEEESSKDESEDVTASEKTKTDEVTEKESSKTEQPNTGEDNEGISKKTKKASAETETSAEGNIYIVQEGDTLASISIQLYHDVGYTKKIMEKNGIENQDMIFAGQKLVLPD
ncbi:LysM peptidoglycan-binding domain-containing protein [Anaeromicropila populeti]|uniref:LysM domain-containing protein n=1 Tax=Anaeromicropila populeti TaxID=37658 RepID=A0A1I6LSM2_9FIRM|nr:LysM domain-containing protein [Anaeromicropila populeti]SFS06487.1 LysM domain-containing protein [Anaeromicropila populeti]